MINQEEYEILKDLDDRLGWLARDSDGDLVAYENKPEKSTRFWFDNGRMVNLGVIFDVGRLFQFIQWEDEEPHNISELIEEYEKNQAYEIFNRQFESLYEKIKETEVKKDIEWLKEKVKKAQPDFVQGYEWTLKVISKDEMYDLIDQLDEPEVLSQELPVIPKYVADWIEDLKSKKLNILESIYDFTHGEDINDYMREQSDVLMRAWLDGYKIEEEQLFYALVKGHELCSDLFKYWNCKAYNSGHLLVGSKYPKASCINRMTKTNWNKIGINESNADFVKAEEVK